MMLHHSFQVMLPNPLLGKQSKPEDGRDNHNVSAGFPNLLRLTYLQEYMKTLIMDNTSAQYVRAK